MLLINWFVDRVGMVCGQRWVWVFAIFVLVASGYGYCFINVGVVSIISDEGLFNAQSQSLELDNQLSLDDETAPPGYEPQSSTTSTLDLPLPSQYMVGLDNNS